MPLGKSACKLDPMNVLEAQVTMGSQDEPFQTRKENCPSLFCLLK